MKAWVTATLTRVFGYRSKARGCAPDTPVNDIDLRLNKISAQLAELRQLDPELRSLGGHCHGYKMNPTLSEAQVEAYEAYNGIRLPEEYREVILKLGNGGAGPGEGLQPLPGINNSGPDLSKPFRYTQTWNMKPTDSDIVSGGTTQAWDAEYWSDKHLDGWLYICHEGCGMAVGLVVTGPLRGALWMDDRDNDQGIYPYGQYGNSIEPNPQIGLLAWLENWLTISIAEMNGDPK